MSNSKMREALRLLLEVQDEECRFDHSGYCQAHNLDHISDGCRVAIARKALTQPDDVPEEIEPSVETLRHDPHCDSLTTILLTMPPKPAPCNCSVGKPEVQP